MGELRDMLGELRDMFYKLGYREYNFNSYNLKSDDHVGDITLKRKGVTIKIEEMKNDTFETLLEKIQKEIKISTSIGCLVRSKL